MSPYTQNAIKNTVKVPPPVPTKPKQANLPSGGQMGYGKTAVNAGTFPGKSKSSAQQPPTGSQSALSQGGTLPLPSKLEAPPAATVHPFSPDPPGAKDSGGQILHKPQMVTTSSIYSMYTQQSTAGKAQQQSIQGALGRAQTRSSNFISGESACFLADHFIQSDLEKSKHNMHDWIRPFPIKFASKHLLIIHRPQIWLIT